MVDYDPEVLQSFAESLYAKSRSIARSNAILGTIVGFVVGFICHLLLHATPQLAGASFLGCVGFGGLLFGVAGYRRAAVFFFKLIPDEVESSILCWF